MVEAVIVSGYRICIFLKLFIPVISPRLTPAVLSCILAQLFDFNENFYLDTSVINFLFADDAPEKQEITIDFFDHYVLPQVYEVYVSAVVIDEISRTRDILQTALN
jgi:hypothetical protein